MDASPFAKLAPELRNRIYEFACASEDSVDIYSGDQPFTRVCKQVRSESLRLTRHARTEYTVTVNPKTIHRLLRCITEHYGHHPFTAIGTLNIHCEATFVEAQSGRYCGKIDDVVRWKELAFALAHCLQLCDEQVTWTIDKISMRTNDPCSSLHYYIAAEVEAEMKAYLESWWSAAIRSANGSASKALVKPVEVPGNVRYARIVELL